MKNETDAKHQMDEYVEAQESGFHRMHRVMVPGCSGPCDQGRKLCPSPEACEVPQDPPMTRSDLSFAVVFVIGLVLYIVFGPMVQGWLA